MNSTTISLNYSIMIVISIILVGGYIMHYLEGWSLIDSYYWAVLTLTTIGTPELIPKLAITKIFIIFYILLGVSLVLYTLTNASVHLLKQTQHQSVNHFKKFGKSIPNKIMTKVNKKMINRIKYKIDDKIKG